MMGYTFLEFFAGGGMARQGLGKDWNCILSNDNDSKKAESYAANWGSSDLIINDIQNITSKDVKGKPSLAWASFPCQDLSVAGKRAGLVGNRSGTYWAFWKIMKQLKDESRNPRLIAVENVVGLLNSHGGKDFQEIIVSLQELGYLCGAVVINAHLFIPQSRPRLFIIATLPENEVKNDLIDDTPNAFWHPKKMVDNVATLTPEQQSKWLWYDPKVPQPRKIDLYDIIEKEITQADKPENTEKLISMMSEVSLERLSNMKKINKPVVGAIYKRTRKIDGKSVQRAELRFDGIAGCLRTPGGGSSRQYLILVNGSEVKTRLITSREAARLMGLPDTYVLPVKYNDAYHLLGDGLAVPAVSFLEREVLKPLLTSNIKKEQDGFAITTRELLLNV